MRETVEQPTAWDHLKSITAPFTDDLWLLIGLTTMVFGIATLWAETPNDDESVGTSQDEGSGDGHMSRLGTLTHAIYESSLGMSTGGGMAPSSRGGMWMNMGFTIFAVLCTASYTANLANLLVVQSSASSSIHSVQDLIRIPGAVLCVPVEHAVRFEELFPALEGRTRRMSQAHVIERIASGSAECAAGIAGTEDLEIRHARNSSCNVVTVGEVLRVAQFSMPVSPTHHWPLSVLSRRLLARDRYGILQTQQRPVTTCPVLNSGLTSLTLECVRFLLQSSAVPITRPALAPRVPKAASDRSSACV